MSTVSQIGIDWRISTQPFTMARSAGRTFDDGWAGAIGQVMAKKISKPAAKAPPKVADKASANDAADYEHLLAGLKQRISEARFRTALSVNRELILLYWDIG